MPQTDPVFNRLGSVCEVLFLYPQATSGNTNAETSQQNSHGRRRANSGVAWRIAKRFASFTLPCSVVAQSLTDKSKAQKGCRSATQTHTSAVQSSRCPAALDVPCYPLTWNPGGPFEVPAGNIKTCSLLNSTHFSHGRREAF